MIITFTDSYNAVSIDSSLVIILLRAPDAVSRAAVPRADGLFHIVLRVVVLLYQDKHLFRLCHVEAVRQLKSFLAFLLFQNVVALFHQNRSYLHGPARVAAHGLGVALALHLNYRVHHAVPVKLSSLGAVASRVHTGQRSQDE